MSYSLDNFIASLPGAIASIYNSPYILTIKIIAGIYLAVLLINITLLLILKDVPGQLKVGLRGMKMPLVTRSQMKKRWKKIKDYLESGNVSQYKVAIIEADKIADEMLDGLGYKGANMMERLEQVGTAHLDDHLEALKGAHQVRNRIVHEEDFEVDQRLAKAIVGVYENFLRYLELLD
jgi:hypothetical protein